MTQCQKYNTVEAIANKLIQDYKYSITPDLVQNIKSELTDMYDICGSIYLDKSDLGIITDDIVLEDVNFGKFKVFCEIYISDNKLCTDETILVESLSKKDTMRNMLLNSIGVETYGNSHPHVSGDMLCAGDYENNIDSLLDNSDIAEAMWIINQILHNYNPYTSFCRIQDYKQIWASGEYKDYADVYICIDCSNIIKTGEVSRKCSVEGCKVAICDECVEYIKFERYTCIQHQTVLLRRKYKRPYISKGKRASL